MSNSYGMNMYGRKLMSKRIKIAYIIILSGWAIYLLSMKIHDMHEKREPAKLIEAYSENKGWKISVTYDEPIIFRKDKNVHIIIKGNNRSFGFITTVESNKRELTDENYSLEINDDFVRLELIDEGKQRGQVYCFYTEDYKDDFDKEK